LSTLSILIEPLRNRPEDIPPLIDYYTGRYNRDLNRTETGGLSPDAIAKLCSYPWPGNVRELQNVLQRIIVLGESEEALDGMLSSAPSVRCDASHGLSAKAPGVLSEIMADNGGRLDLADLSLKKIRKKAMNRVERDLIGHVLIKTGWNRSKASRILKISYKTLLQKIDELAIVPPPELA
jgi:DNA-binding NtrC family response regulator